MSSRTWRGLARNIEYALLAWVGAFTASLAANFEPSQLVPPRPLREFRGAWVATVANIDWPSKPGLSTWEQQRELVAILDRATTLGLNAIILQVRPGG